MDSPSPLVVTYLFSGRDYRFLLSVTKSVTETTNYLDPLSKVFRFGHRRRPRRVGRALTGGQGSVWESGRDQRCLGTDGSTVRMVPASIGRTEVSVPVYSTTHTRT